MKKLLLAYDGSLGATAAMEGLAYAGLPDELTVKVLAIADVWVPPDALKNTVAFPEVVPQARVKARQHAVKALHDAKEIARSAAGQLKGRFPGWHVDAIARADSPAWAIIAEARKFEADLVVLGAHSKGILQTFFLGSTSQKVASQAPCSVRIVRPIVSNRIVIGIDGSADSNVAVRMVASRKWQRETEFDLITVVDPRLESASAWPTFFSDSFPSEEESAKAIATLVREQQQILQKAGYTVHTHVLVGDPKVQLLDKAAALNASAIFIGARGLQHGDRAYLGTMAAAICARAHCTVEIVRPHGLMKAMEPLEQMAKPETPTDRV